jgi:hypothetical protein
MQSRSFFRNPILGMVVILAYLTSDLTRFRAQAACAECQAEHQFVSVTKSKHLYQEFKTSGDTNEIKMFLELHRTYSITTGSSSSNQVGGNIVCGSNLGGYQTNSATSSYTLTRTDKAITTLSNSTPVTERTGNHSSSANTWMTGEDKGGPSCDCPGRITVATNATTAYSETSTVSPVGSSFFWIGSSTNTDFTAYSIYYPACTGPSYSPTNITVNSGSAISNEVVALNWNPAGTLVTDEFNKRKWVDGEQYWEEELKNEFTTGQLKSLAVAAMPDFSGTWQPGTASAYYWQPDFKRTAEVAKMKYRFKVLGEKGEDYKVWYRKLTHGPKGELVSVSLESENVTGAGPLT